MNNEFLPIQSFDMDSKNGGKKPLGFDLFIHLPLNQKYVLFRRKGQILEEDRLKKLADFNVQNFFIRREDYNSFIVHVAQRLRGMLELKTEDRKHATRTAARSLLHGTLTSDDPVV